MNPKISLTNVTRWTRIGALCAAASLLCTPAVAQDQGGDDPVNVTEFDTVDIRVSDEELSKVLEMLALQSKKNIVTSKGVSGTVNANLFNVTFEKALDAILSVNGYTWEEEGNFIYVYTQAEWAEIEASRRQLEYKVFVLDYLSAADAFASIEPMLSEDGSATLGGDVAAGIDPDISDVGADSFAFAARLVVHDYAENIEKVALLLDELDTAPQQVLVESTILQTQLDENNSFGVDFTAVGSLSLANVSSPLGAVGDIISGAALAADVDEQQQGIISSVGNTTDAGGLKVAIVDDDVAAFLKLLDEVVDSQVLARPKIMALNRQRAEVLVGARVGYLSTTATETTTTQTVEFLDTGINLVFRPFISKNGMIRLELAPSVSEANLRQTTDAEGRLRIIPDEITNELTTNVRVRDGETLVLGGLFRESISKSRRQVPGLGSIPLIGNVFKGQDDNVERNEIIFLITPTIVHDESLWSIGDQAHDDIAVAQIGAREGLLTFGRTKQTDSYNHDAWAAWDRGDTEKALYYINNSLRLDPGQPEMIRFRERVTGQKMKLHERSMGERLMRRELGDLVDRTVDSTTTPGNTDVEIVEDTETVEDTPVAQGDVAIEQPVLAAPEATIETIVEPTTVDPSMDIVEPVDGFGVEIIEESNDGNPLAFNFDSVLDVNLPSTQDVIETLTETSADIASGILLVAELAAIPQDDVLATNAASFTADIDDSFVAALATTETTLDDETVETIWTGYRNLPQIYMQMVFDAFEDCEGVH